MNHIFVISYKPMTIISDSSSELDTAVYDMIFILSATKDYGSMTIIVTKSFSGNSTPRYRSRSINLCFSRNVLILISDMS